jgi:hypothetical protein
MHFYMEVVQKLKFPNNSNEKNRSDNMKMSKNVHSQTRIIITLVFVIIIASLGHAQVVQDEMRDLPPVTFINYEGPHTRVDTREAIRQIGVGLGMQIAARESDMQQTLDAMTFEQRREFSYIFEIGAHNRYFVIHSISGPEDNKLDADILGLGVDVGVDHIRNLRVIIQGYLQSAYNYSATDALLLAEFITIYNAVYRGNWDFFVNRFKTPVINHLTIERAGLSIRYDQWPGRTLILIPLGHPRISAIDTTAITDARVIEEMRREDDDQGVPQRQRVVELLERETEQAERRVQEERQRIREEERQITEDRRRVDEERRETEEARSLRRITEDQAATALENLNRRETELTNRQRDLEQLREDLRETEENIEQRADHAQDLREDVARDQQAAIDQATRDAVARGDDPAVIAARGQDAATGPRAGAGIIGVTIERQTPTTMGRIVRLDPSSGRELGRSPQDFLIHTRTVTTLGGGRVFAIAGEDIGNVMVALVEINPASLEIINQGRDDIQPGSLLWSDGNNIYAITINLRNNQCFIGRFNMNLELQARSTVRIHPESSVLIQQGNLLTQRENGFPLILNPVDLTEAR